MQCPNDGCQEVFGANTAGAHDASCPWKRMPCPQGCALEVTRRVLRAHMAGPCERRPVVCPYHHLGCLTAVFAGTLDNHCKDGAGEHLALVAARVGRRGLGRELARISISRASLVRATPSCSRLRFPPRRAGAGTCSLNAERSPQRESDNSSDTYSIAC
jgi:homogentisate solanesyltransferase